MGALTAADVTVVVTETTRVGKKKLLHGTIAFGDGSKTYPTAGVPLPAISSFGLLQQLDVLMIFGINELTTDYVYRYNKSAHKLLMYEEEATAAGGPLLECDTSEAPAARTLNFFAIGW